MSSLSESPPDADRPTTPTLGRGQGFLRRLLGLAWPIVISRSTQTVIGVADAVMVAFLGEEALAATTTGAFNTFALLILPMGVVFIVASFSSQLFGRGDPAAARRYAWYGLGVAVLTQIACMVAALAAPAVIARTGHAPEVQRLMAEYLGIRLFAGGAAIGIEALANYYGGLGNTRLPMLISVLAMVLNVAFNWLLIGGNLGAPALGVAGAAWASALASTVAFGVFLAVFLLEGRGIPPVFRHLSVRELGRMIRFGLPSGLNWFFEFMAFNLFVNLVLAGLGTTSLAAFMAVLQINSASFMPAFGLTSGGAILVGQAIGSDRKDEVSRVVGVTFRACVVWQGLVGVAYLLVPGLLLAPFAPSGDPGPFLLAGSRILMLTAAWQLFDAAVNTLAEALRAAGDTSFTLLARSAMAWGLFVPGSYVSVRVLGGGDLVAVGWVVGYLALLAGVLYLRFRGGAWRRIQLVGEPPPPP